MVLIIALSRHCRIVMYVSLVGASLSIRSTIQRERRGFEDGENMSGPAVILDSSLSTKAVAFDSPIENRDRDGPGAIPWLLSETLNLHERDPESSERRESLASFSPHFNIHQSSIQSCKRFDYTAGSTCLTPLSIIVHACSV